VSVLLLPNIGKSTAPDVSQEFWLYESLESPGTLIASANIDETDPRIRAWCYAMGRESRARPFPIGAAFFVYRGVYIKIQTPSNPSPTSGMDVEAEDYLLAATAARKWINTHPRFERFRSPAYGINPASFGNTSIDWFGIVMSVIIVSTAVLCIIRWLQHIKQERGNARRYKRLSSGNCPTCEYDLRGDYQRPCPECGSSVGDPPNPA